MTTATIPRRRRIDRRSRARSRACRAASAARSSSLRSTLARRYSASPTDGETVVVSGPGLDALEAGAAQEEALVPARGLPLRGGRRERVPDAEVVPRLVDPPSEPVPGAEERLVRDLDGRLSGRRVAIEREQTVTP